MDPEDPGRDGALARLVERLGAEDVAFPWYGIGLEEGGIKIDVSTSAVEVAEAWFRDHPVTTAAGEVVPVEVVPRAGEVFLRPADPGAPLSPRAVPEEELIGVDVHAAAALATAAGWQVRATEPQGILTADHRGDRLTMVYDDVTRLVLRVAAC